MPKRLDHNAPYWLQIRAAEKQIIEYAHSAGGDLPQTAILLGISLPHLRRRVRALGLSAQFGVRKMRKSRKSAAKRRKLAKQTASRKLAAQPQDTATVAVRKGAKGKPRTPRQARPTPGTTTPTGLGTDHAPATSIASESAHQGRRAEDAQDAQDSRTSSP